MVLNYKLKEDTNISQLLKEVKEGGLRVDGDERAGKISGKGIEANYKIDGKKLMISITKKPFFITEGRIKSELDSYFGKQIE